MILDYNDPKVVCCCRSDALFVHYKRMTRRWPMAICNNMLDISALNEFVVRIALIHIGKSTQSTWDDSFCCSYCRPTYFHVIRKPAKKRARFEKGRKDEKTHICCGECGQRAFQEHLNQLQAVTLTLFEQCDVHMLVILLIILDEFIGLKYNISQ